MEETETSCNVLCEQPNQVNLPTYILHIYTTIYILVLKGLTWILQ